MTVKMSAQYHFPLECLSLPIFIYLAFLSLLSSKTFGKHVLYFLFPPSSLSNEQVAIVDSGLLGHGGILLP